MQIASLIDKHHYTYNDYIAIDDDKRYEVMEGTLKMVPAPATYHQRVSREIEYAVIDFVKENNLGEVFDAPTDVVLAEDVVVQPDIFFIIRDRLNIIEKQAIVGPPDLIIEIVSPSSTFQDVVKKKDLYQRFGVKEYWIVFPEEKAIEVMTIEEGIYKEFCSTKDEGIVRSKVLHGLNLELKGIFEF